MTNSFGDTLLGAAEKYRLASGFDNTIFGGPLTLLSLGEVSNELFADVCITILVMIDGDESLPKVFDGLII